MTNVISLAGNWFCRLDPDNRGASQEWYKGTLEEHTVALPGSTQTNDIGPRYATKLISNLTPNTEHTGPAWYWREIELSESDYGQHIELLLERVCWQSFAWLNGKALGSRDSLVSPHLYDLTTAVRPGANRLTVMVDNANLKTSSGGGIDKMAEDEELVIEANAERRLNCGGHHASFGGAPWNGITGRIELQIRPLVRVTPPQVYPDVDARRAIVNCSAINNTDEPVPATVVIEVDGQTIREERMIAPGTEQLRLVVDLADGCRLWDNHSPELYQLCAKIESKYGVDQHHAEFGMRSVTSVDNRFAINGKPVFLRGALEKFVHPITGYPPTDLDYWLKIFQVHKDHGLNHLRFHSCCPPEAGFAAADRLGIILNVELPGSSGGETTDDLTQNFLQDEAIRILDEFGNHPSFCMLTMGNEVLEDEVAEADGMARLMKRVARCKEHDSRHWYCCTAHAYTPKRDDDFYVTAWPNGDTAHERHRGEPIRGFRWNGDDVVDDCRFNTRPPETTSDYRDGIAGIPRPVITHEVGMWAVYPDVSEVPRFTGVMKPYNLEIIRGFMEEKGALERTGDFVKASGKLSALLYKEEIEAAMRTPGLSGLQLLGIHDHPPQGTSTIGIVTALRESKGIITPEEFREFCSDTVPLARLERRTFTSAETFSAAVDIAHYGPTTLNEAAFTWRLSQVGSDRIVHGTFDATDVPAGELTTLGDISVDLRDFDAPAKLELEVSLAGTSIRNRWDCWVYPAATAMDAGDVIWTQEWSPELAAAVEAGGTAVVELGKHQIPHATRGCFTTLLWNPIMKRKHYSQTMGVLCDPSHPAFAQFPTESHTNWQWWDVIHPSLVLDLDGMATRPESIIRMVDSFIGNRHLSPLFEAGMGNGRLIVTSLDLSSDLTNRHAARQLRQSLLAYAASDACRPTTALRPTDIDGLLTAHQEPPSVPTRLRAARAL